MKLDDLKAAFPTIVETQAFKALWDEDKLSREFVAETLSLSRSDMDRLDLIRELALSQVHLRTLLAVFERYMADRRPLDEAHVQYVLGRSEASLPGAKAAAKARLRTDWLADAEAFWKANPDWAKNKVATEIVKKRSTNRIAVDKSSVMRAITPLIPTTSPSHPSHPDYKPPPRRKG